MLIVHVVKLRPVHSMLGAVCLIAAAFLVFVWGRKFDPLWLDNGCTTYVRFVRNVVQIGAFRDDWLEQRPLTPAISFVIVRFERFAFAGVKGNGYRVGWHLLIPYWTILVLLSVPIFFWMRQYCLIARQTKWAQSSRCAECGYDIRASCSVCSECGTPITRARPR
jgi:hypothetical protein